MLRRNGGDCSHRAETLAFAVALVAFLPGCEKWQLDAQVRELCAKDGGMKIYETVALPPDQFDKWGMVKLYRPTGGEDALGPEYIYRQQDTYIRRGNPELWRSHTAVVRRSDGKVLGEIVRYTRRGGDMPGPWADSSLSCPPIETDRPDLLQSVFVRSASR